jgi:catalase (peroxidase I)
MDKNKIAPENSAQIPTDPVVKENGKCPVTGRAAAGTGTSNKFWWPNQLNLGILHQHSPASNPMDPDFSVMQKNSVN